MSKYIHVLFGDGLGVALRLAEMLHDEELNFNVSEHKFVTNQRRVYENMVEKYDVEYTNPKNPAMLINIYAPECDYLICHGMPKFYKNLVIKPQYFKKIIWRSWGHDAGYNYDPGEFFKNIIKWCGNLIWRVQVRSFHAVGIANTVDLLDVRERFGNVKIYRMPYARKKDNILKELEVNEYQKKDAKTRVLLGHYGFPIENHIEILKQLQRFPVENLEIYLVLAYGNRAYINNVCEYIHENNICNAIIVDKQVEFDEYVEFLKNMDIAILDGDKSCALGNIVWLLKCKKTIFLNRKGVIKRAFDYDNVPCYCTDEIANMTYEEFITPLNYDDIETDLLPRNYEKNVGLWRTLLTDLEKEKCV